jgi:predicted nucleic acid-binding protein
LIVLDSDIVIDFLWDRRDAVGFLEALRRQDEILATTSICAAEVLRGVQFSRAALDRATTFLQAMQEIPFGPRAARRYGRLMDGLDRAGRPIRVTDGLIAAATLEAGARLATRNVRDFRKVPGLEVVTPDDLQG